MSFYTVTIDDTGEFFRCKSEESLLSGMERLGKRGIPVGCRGGGCGVCKVQVVAGTYRKRVMSRAFISPEDEANGVVLACRVCPDSDIHLSVLGRMRKSVCAPHEPKELFPRIYKISIKCIDVENKYKYRYV